MIPPGMCLALYLKHLILEPFIYVERLSGKIDLHKTSGIRTFQCKSIFDRGDGL